MKSSLLMLALCVTVGQAFAQKTSPEGRPDIKQGNILPGDFSKAPYAIDSSAHAVVLMDIGESEFTGNNQSSFDLIYTHQKRIHIINKNGFDHATVQIPLYTSKNKEESLQSLVAYTYNLEGDKVAATKVEKSSIFIEKQNEYYKLCKFTFPNLKEGSIIEFKYKVVSPFIHNLQPWNFQDAIPTLWSEYTVGIPSVLDFLILYQGYREFDYTHQNVKNMSYRVTIDDHSYQRSSVDVNTPVTTSTWAIKNVPALKHENFTSSISNHLQRIFFQLRTVRYDENKPIQVMNTWEQVMTELAKDNNFGGTLSQKHEVYEQEVLPSIGKVENDLDKAKGIYRYVRSRFKSSGPGSIYLKQSIRKLAETKNGSAAEINLFLTAMLRNGGFTARPVILSTRANGIAPDMFPILNEFNYVICLLELDNKKYLLDASRKKMGFGHLPLYAYNGQARVVDELPLLMNLSSDSIQENSVVSVSINNTDSGTELEGSVTIDPGYYESIDIRDELDNKTDSAYFAEVEKKFEPMATIGFKSIDGLKEFESPLNIYYEFKTQLNEDVLYFNPMLMEKLKENPFKSQKREYPVEMPYVMNRRYTLNMEIPKGYSVDEMPKSEKLLLNDKDGYFEYVINNNGRNIILNARIMLAKSTFLNADYEPLREFFGVIVKKHAEMIVFKKNK
ncbi:MAG TPA: DUF3857 domain-containing protein [Ferruginibacter sp.]|nr:DUF3857 domain-containing protein [Ferruginibacter sp.]HRO05126.1 DUF3857 domain-containing protein [Ferruginibacter sp.]HRO95569.1 DUF3857 domain-containing protein [Ferruginibacter sp.]HRP49572.1 DUF3857 domain-containing protein [Ferruginibacter sp.]